MEPNLCVLMDFENIAAGAEKEGHGRFDTAAVMTRLKEKGRILISRSYGDWGRFAKYKQAMLEQSIQAVELTSYRGQDKNRADIALAVDAMELAFRRDYIDTFVLLSGDSDFTPLVMRLRELDRRVIGIGTRKSSSRLLVESCDEFIFYESIVRSKRSSSSGRTRSRSGRSSSGGGRDRGSSNSDAVESLSKDDAFAMLAETIEGIQRDEPGAVLAGRIKQSILRKVPSFDESEYGFAGFARFLEGARERGLVTLRTDERAGGYRVDVAEDADAGESKPSGDDEPLLKGEPGRLREVLVKAGHDPLTSMMRHVVVHEFVDHVTERARKNKRNTLIYTVGDVARRTRQTDPPVRSRQVRSVLYSVMAAGELIHADGDPIRKDSATYTVKKDAEELLRVLRGFYVKLLIESGEKLGDSKALSQLLWGDDDHVHAVEELVAWAQWELSEDDGKAPPAEVVATPEEAEARGAERKAEAEEEEEAPKKKRSTRKRKTSTRKKAESAKEADVPDPLEDEEPPKKRRRKKKAATADEEGAAAEKADAEKTEEKPKKKRTTRRKKTSTKKKEDEAAKDEGGSEAKADDKADAEKAEEKPKKKRTTRRKKTSTKKKEDEAAKDEGGSDDKADDKAAEKADAEKAEEKPKKKRTTRRKKASTKKKEDEAAKDEGGSDDKADAEKADG